jgi:allantoin racemase
VGLSREPEHLEYRYYSALVTADVLHTLMDAEKNGYDAAIVGCFFDPGLQEAREVTTKMAVAAPVESAMHIASTLGCAFSIIVGRSKWVPLL